LPEVIETGPDTPLRNPAWHYARAEEKRATGDELAALAHLIAAQTLDSYAANPALASARALCDVATGYFMKGDRQTAAYWYRLVLALDPRMAVPYQNLAAIYDGMGRQAEADACRQQAYKIQRVFVDEVGTPAHRVLVLCTGQAAGNIGFEVLLPTRTFARIKYAIDFAAEEEDGALPPFDLVFNAIGEPDIAARLDERLRRFALNCDRPLLNAPQAVIETQRQRLPGLLAELEGVVAPACIRSDQAPGAGGDRARQLAEAGLAFPLLARPAAAHGGAGLVRCDNVEALDAWLGQMQGEFYLTAFHDSADAAGYYRKYRMICIGGQAFPYHLAISRDWMVHYFSADMERHPWKVEEERRFLADPAAVLGKRAINAIAGIGQRLGLDYGGIDFTVLPDGRVLVFEANATMLVHPERNDGPLAHKNVYVERIVAAFGQMLADRRQTLPGQ